MVAHNDNIDARIRELHAQGLVDREIGERIGLHRTTVAIRRTRMGLPINGFHRWTANEQRRVVAMAEAGESRAAIAAAIGVTEAAVARRISKLFGDELDARKVRAEAKRMRAWDLFAAGERPASVARIMGIDPVTACRYRQQMPACWADKKCQTKGVDR